MDHSFDSSRALFRSHQHPCGALPALALHLHGGGLQLLNHEHLVQADHCGPFQAREGLRQLHMQSEHCSSGEQQPLHLVAIGDGVGVCSVRHHEMH